MCLYFSRKKKRNDFVLTSVSFFLNYNYKRKEETEKKNVLIILRIKQRIKNKNVKHSKNHTFYNKLKAKL